MLNSEPTTKGKDLSFTLADLLWIDDQYGGNLGLADCFGDRFLCSRNALFNAVRRAFLKIGGNFREATGFELGRRYLVAPLLCLEEILQTNTVPYRASVPTVRIVAHSAPSFQTTIGTLATLISPNYLLHESCHCISATLIGNHRHNDSYRRIAMLVCGEAFANTVEQLAMAETATPADGAFFFMNSYMGTLNAAPIIRVAIEEVGFASVFSIAMLCFFCANLYPTSPPDDLITRFMRECKIPRQPGEEDILKRLIPIFTLRKSFRDGTSPAYFQLLGLEEEFRLLTQGSFSYQLVTDLDIAAKVTTHLEHIAAALQRSSD